MMHLDYNRFTFFEVGASLNPREPSKPKDQKKLIQASGKANFARFGGGFLAFHRFMAVFHWRHELLRPHCR
jgi:hypothetical protein